MGLLLSLCPEMGPLSFVCSGEKIDAPLLGPGTSGLWDHWLPAQTLCLSWGTGLLLQPLLSGKARPLEAPGGEQVRGTSEAKRRGGKNCPGGLGFMLINQLHRCCEWSLVTRGCLWAAANGYFMAGGAGRKLGFYGLLNINNKLS